MLNHLSNHIRQTCCCLPAKITKRLRCISLQLSTSVGRKYRGSTRTNVLPVLVQTPISSTPAPSHRSLTSTSWNASSTNSRTVLKCRLPKHNHPADFAAGFATSPAHSRGRGPNHVLRQGCQYAAHAVAPVLSRRQPRNFSRDKGFATNWTFVIE